MTDKEKLYYLLKEYNEGRYDTISFCDQFTVVFDTEVDYETLNEQENELFCELSVITARFSPFEEDLKIPNIYFKEENVRSKVREVIGKLNL